MIIRNHKPTPLVLTDVQKRSLRSDVPTPQSAPSKGAKIKNASKATVRIVKAAVKGERVRVSSDDRDRRLAICRSCDLWNEGGNVGLGECRHPGCGCTRFKHGLATETCPLGKWEVPEPIDNDLNI